MTLSDWNRLSMSTSRRAFLQLSAASAALGTSVGDAGAQTRAATSPAPTPGPPPAPITEDERRARIEKARRLMAEQKLQALVLEPGSSLFYYTGVRWGLSERPFLLVIPAKGELAYVTPGFEEQRARELTQVHHRHSCLAGGREPVPAGRPHPGRPRHHDGPGRDRRAHALLHRRRRCARKRRDSSSWMRWR